MNKHAARLDALVLQQFELSSIVLFNLDRSGILPIYADFRLQLNYPACRFYSDGRYATELPYHDYFWPLC